MFLLTDPSRTTIQDFLDAASALPFSYPHVGQTRPQNVPAGYDRDHNRVRIGRGSVDYQKAKHAIDAWKMFDFPWLRLVWNDTPIEVGRNVAILVRHMGFYSLNASRIIYVFDENSDDISRYGFAYGTLTDHNEQGEERFCVELNWKTDEVWYDLYAFSKPKHPLARLGYFYSRHLQREFVKSSKAAMARAVSGDQD